MKVRPLAPTQPQDTTQQQLRAGLLIGRLALSWRNAWSG
jgi:hypothetical protein